VPLLKQLFMVDKQWDLDLKLEMEDFHLYIHLMVCFDQRIKEH
jgi:hypothetical protein